VRHSIWTFSTADFVASKVAPISSAVTLSSKSFTDYNNI
jgi:hypothetical protein